MRSAPAASRTRGCCSPPRARSRAASATATTWSAASSTSIRPSPSATCSTRRRCRRGRVLCPDPGASWPSAGVLNAGLRLYADAPPPPLGPGKAAARSLACSADFLAALAERVLGRPPGCERDGLGAWLARGGAPAPQVGRVEIASEQALDRDCRVRLGRGARRPRDAAGGARVAARRARRPHDPRGDRGAGDAPRRAGDRRGCESATGCWPTRRPSPASPTTWSAGRTTSARRGWPTTRGPASSTATAACTAWRTSTSGAASVFATGGHVNPTYTIVQLALRLGDHLTGRLRA